MPKVPKVEKWKFLRYQILDDFVRSRNFIEFVIPAEAGIQGFP